MLFDIEFGAFPSERIALDPHLVHKAIRAHCLKQRASEEIYIAKEDMKWTVTYTSQHALLQSCIDTMNKSSRTIEMGV